MGIGSEIFTSKKSKKVKSILNRFCVQSTYNSTSVMIYSQLPLYRNTRDLDISSIYPCFRYKGMKMNAFSTLGRYIYPASI